MDRKAPISDATISKNVTQQLASRGLRAPCRIQVQTRNGEVTLSGTVQFVHQRDAAIQAIRTVEGIKRVFEKLKVTPGARHQYQQSTGQPAKPTAIEATHAETEADTADEQPEASIAVESLPASDRQASAAADDATDFSLAAAGPQAASRATTAGMLHSRKGDSYTFECASPEEAEKLRVLLARYADWLKKNSWVGDSKSASGSHRVIFHAKSVIEFLRQEGF